MPNPAATRHPTTAPITAPHSRSAPLARSTITTVTAIVASAVSGAAPVGAPSGARNDRSKPIGITVTAISMITVPATVGVMKRRSSDRRDEIRNWKRDEATMRVASSAGPPRSSAATDTAMKTPDVPISRMYPAPMRPPIGFAWMSVVIPQTISAAKAAHAR